MTPSSALLLDCIHRLVPSPAPDAVLLERFSRFNDESAFTDLVTRHGPLVWRVCRRVLADPQAAEEAFQATFLVLARRVKTIRNPSSVAAWLHGVAYRLALKIQKAEAKHHRQEPTVTNLDPVDPRPDPLAEVSAREALLILEEEIERLPENYRLPVILCCLEGLSQEETARRLNWSTGSVKGRLERGRKRLQGRLLRRGLALTTLLGAVAMSRGLTMAGSGRILEAWTVRLVMGFWKGETGQMAGRVAALADWGLKSLAVAKAKMTVTLVLAAGLVVAGAGTMIQQSFLKIPSAPEQNLLAGGSARAEVKENPPQETDLPVDPLPAGSILRFGTSRFRHGTAIEGLAVAPDGKFALSASGNHWLGCTRAFDLITGSALYTLQDSGYFVEALALSPDGRILATKQNNQVSLRNPSTGKEFRKIALATSNPRTITSWLTFTPDGKALAVAAPEGKAILLLDLQQGEVIRSFVYQNVVFAAAFSTDGRLLAGGGYDHEGNTYFGRLWEVASGKELRRFSCGNRGIRALAFSPGGTTLAGGGDDARLRFWNVATGQEKRVFPADGYRIRSVAFSPDGRTVAAAGDSLRLYDAETGQERWHLDRKATCLQFPADGRSLIAAVAGAIYRWDLATGRPLTPTSAGDSAVDQVAVTANGRRVVTRDQAGQIHLWDGNTGKHLGGFKGEYQRGFGLSPDGRFLAWPIENPSLKFKIPEEPNVTYEGNRLRLYDLVTRQFQDRFPSFPGEAHDLGFTPNSRTLVTVDHRDGGVRLWDVATGQPQRTFKVVRDAEKGRTYQIWRTVLSPDGRTLAVAYQRSDYTTAFFGPVPVRLWDLETGKERHELTGHVNEVLDLAFSPDNRFLVTCGENPRGPGKVRRSPVDQVVVWEVATGERVSRKPEGLGLGAGSVAFSSDGRTLATASADGVIRLWEVVSWTVRAEFRGHRDRVSALYFSPDGRLFSGSLDTTVLAWDVKPPPKTNEGSLDSAWEDLAQPEAMPAFKALGQFRAAPLEAVKLIAARVKPAKGIDARDLTKLIGDLDSDQFSARESATNSLKKLGRGIVPKLREIKEASPSAEVRRRVGDLLALWETSGISSDELREIRAVEALELIATPEAHHLLKELARGDPDAFLTREVQSALRRIDRSKKLVK